MTLAYFDCFAGAGGDMIVGALIDAGCDFEALKSQLARLHAHGCSLSVEKVQRGGIAGTKFNVEIAHEHHPHRHLGDILAMIDVAGLPARAAERAKKVFTRLGQAEAAVHNVPLDHVHFHEVGALDSIMDIVGACVAMEILDIDRVICSPLPLGSGTIESDHGTLPVPAPATARLLVGAKTVPGLVQGEAVTPTAAALLTTLAESFGESPALAVAAVGYGAGTRNQGPVPNLLRVILGQDSHDGEHDVMVELSANIDDCTGEVIGAAIEKLLAFGAVDAWASPLVMKNSRPAWMLSALCRPSDAAAIETLFFEETTTFGVRRRVCQRAKLRRRHETVETPYGPLRVKVGSLGEQDVTAAPEFSDCLAAAQAHHVSVREVMAAATEIYRRESRHG